MTSRDSIRFGDAVIEYEVRRSVRRKKTVQITVDGGAVRVAAPSTTPRREIQEFCPEEGALDCRSHGDGRSGSCSQKVRQR